MTYKPNKIFCFPSRCFITATGVQNSVPRMRYRCNRIDHVVFWEDSGRILELELEKAIEHSVHNWAVMGAWKIGMVREL